MVPTAQLPLLRSALGACSRPISRMLVRAMNVTYWQDPFALNRPAARRPRGRFNTKAGANVLYLGDDYLTAAEETLLRRSLTG